MTQFDLQKNKPSTDPKEAFIAKEIKNKQSVSFKYNALFCCNSAEKETECFV